MTSNEMCLLHMRGIHLCAGIALTGITQIADRRTKPKLSPFIMLTIAFFYTCPWPFQILDCCCYWMMSDDDQLLVFNWWQIENGFLLLKSISQYTRSLYSSLRSSCQWTCSQSCWKPHSGQELTVAGVWFVDVQTHKKRAIIQHGG